MRLADAEGLEGLSMRRLAGALGVTPMSLYNHVAGKEELLDAMVDAVVAQIDSPEIDGDWRAMMRRRALSMREVLMRHRWASIPLISRMTSGAAILRDTNATLGCLVTAGFTYPQADWARNAIDNHVYGYAFQEVNYPVDPEGYKAAASRFLPRIPASEYPFLHEAARQIAEARYDGITRFEFGLDLILDGLEAWKDAE
ncbi:MAG: TetR family transcriptional regulator [Maritimibacter sp.]|nr:TetR family transcriptional regulator [Maritimibacter sp.]